MAGSVPRGPADVDPPEAGSPGSASPEPNPAGAADAPAGAADAPAAHGSLIDAKGVAWATGRDGRPIAMLGATPLLGVPWELFVMGVTLLSVANIALYALPVLSTDVRSVVFIVDLFLTIPLLLDFALRYRRAPDRSAYLVGGRGWLDLVGSLPLPFLRLVRLVRVRRIGRHLGQRGFRGLVRALLREPASGALLGIVLLTIVVIEIGSAVVLVIEAPAAGATITTPIDALWFSYQTITTVGYGDVTPVTVAGRLVGVVVLTLGIALFGTVTGYLANAFLSRPVEATPTGAGQGAPSGSAAAATPVAAATGTPIATAATPPGDAPGTRAGPADAPATRGDVDALRTEIAELRRTVAELVDRERTP